MPALRAKLGTFPSFWQELDAWAEGEGWRAVYKAYLTATEKPGDDVKSEPSGVKRDAPGAGTAAADAPVPRKKKSRWGAKTAAAPPNPSNTGVGAPPNDASTAPSRGRSRWGDKAAVPATAQTVALPGGGVISLTPTQSAAYMKLQMSLRDIQTKITNIAVDARRVEGLPKGHADRR